MRDQEIIKIIDDFYVTSEISKENLTALLSKLLGQRCGALHNYLFSKARLVQMKSFGRKIYKRCLIEVSNYCVNDCYYCGIRGSNLNVKRYRLSTEDVLEACSNGYAQGMRTFVLQGGEDFFYKSEEFTNLIKTIRTTFPDCAITLSLGEADEDTYKKWFDAGADRYLLRHETANEEHYNKLHPSLMSLDKRKQCLFNLKEIGYQVGAGFMVGSPYQNKKTLAEDIMFLAELKPHMVGLGPFIPHASSKFKDFEAGSVIDTRIMLAIVRLLLPKVLLPATTALNTISYDGYENGILAGANVVMINFTPQNEGRKYELYDGKIYVDGDPVMREKEIKARFEKIGYELVESRGDY